MDPFSYIDRLRNKSDRERTSIALTTSGIGVAIVFLIWVSVTVPKITTMVQSSADDTTAAVNDALPAMKDLEEAFGEIGEQIGTIKDSVSTMMASGTPEEESEFLMEPEAGVDGSMEGEISPAPPSPAPPSPQLGGEGEGESERAPLPGFGTQHRLSETDGEGTPE